MRDEVFFSVGAKDLDTSSYQVSDLEDIEFNWEDSQLDMDAVFRPGRDTPFSPTTFDDLSKGDQLKTHCVGRGARNGEFCSCSINTRVCQTHGTYQTAEKSRFWNKNRKCA